jgi:hypothetical protein
MGERDPGEQDGDSHIEVSEIDASSLAPSTARSPFESQRTAVQRRRRLLGSVAIGLLLMAATVSAIPGVRSRVGQVFARPSPTPASVFVPPPLPNSNLFYLLPNPPGVDVSLDGRALASFPIPGAPHPLRLTPGRHVLAWTSKILPFAPRSCVLTVPDANGDTCPFVSAQTLQSENASLPGRIIAIHGSLTLMDPRARDALVKTIGAALTAATSHAIVRTGEEIVGGNGESGTPPGLPFRAALSYQFLPAGGYPEPCVLGAPAIPCRYLGQDCSALCTMPEPTSSVVGQPFAWLAAALVHANWTYATLDGQVVGSHLGEELGIQLALLDITLDDGEWHVAPIFGHVPRLPVADDVVCDPARYWLEQNGVWSFMVVDPPPDGTAQFASDANPTDGCVAVLIQYPGTPPAIFLERFGVLLAVNTAAYNPVAGFPMADAAEQRLAMQIATRAGIHV